ncbi:DUF6588 family protein [Leeuwenhoekiella marinoflava]|uniref:Outer membrane protein with beta-barrel domain n=2 Tax=Leeuwenhoekiella marinoflava TaxID=988 RepID=A0A4Q0P1Y4_9FLAO|nr:DUF6588 family protein [Leeuwenhoekiella marinoflava]RXG20261.1 hypothetical protein DSL99_4133 [Leeuwenhoekiella marinoflava]SHG08333.1 hypothetical protein SAMN02745246_04136 [Leeuwenhoekiella marinoflava DSM 3653]
MKKILLFLSAITISTTALAQDDDGFEAIIVAGAQDANTLMGAYISPAMEGLVYSMSGGWYHTAKTHKKLGFDITIGVNAAIVPSEKELFAFADLDFQNTITATSGTTPTVAGGGTPADVTVVTQDGDTGTFTMPEGIKDDLPLNAMPAPTLQASVGLIYDTDLMVRATPKLGSDDVKGSLFGVGLKHNLMQYFGPLDKLPLNIAVMGAFTSMSIDYDIEDGSSIDGVNQAAEFKLNSYTFQGVASLDFPFITVYGGLGYTGGKSELNVLGTYNVDYNGGADRTTLIDPIALSYSPSSVRASLGARLNLAFFKIYADYTVQEYNNLSAGIAFSFR